MLLSVRSKSWQTESVSKGSARSNMRKRKPPAKPNKFAEKRNSKLTVNKNESRRMRDIACSKKSVLLIRLSVKLQSCSRLKQERMVKKARRMKRQKRVRRLSRRPLHAQPMRLPRLRVLKVPLMMLSNIKSLKLSNLKKILKKNPESMPILLKIKKALDQKEMKSVKEVIAELLVVVVVIVAVVVVEATRTRTWSIEPRLIALSQFMTRLPLMSNSKIRRK